MTYKIQKVSNNEKDALLCIFKDREDLNKWKSEMMIIADKQKNNPKFKDYANTINEFTDRLKADNGYQKKQASDEVHFFIWEEEIADFVNFLHGGLTEILSDVSSEKPASTIPSKNTETEKENRQGSYAKGNQRVPLIIEKEIAVKDSDGNIVIDFQKYDVEMLRIQKYIEHCQKETDMEWKKDNSRKLLTNIKTKLKYCDQFKFVAEGMPDNRKFVSSVFAIAKKLDMPVKIPQNVLRYMNLSKDLFNIEKENGSLRMPKRRTKQDNEDFKKLKSIIVKYHIDFNGFLYTDELYSFINCEKNFFKSCLKEVYTEHGIVLKD